MDIQRPLETAIATLVDEFIRSPYAFFSEADAVACFHQLLSREPQFGHPARSKDGYEIGLVHREYPTFFRFDDCYPNEKREPPARRGHYDTVILDPRFVEAHPVETVLNRDINTVRDMGIAPFQAVVEFKLYTRGWSKAEANGTIAELGKLRLSSKDAKLRYLVVLVRQADARTHRWEGYWSQVRDATAAEDRVCSFFVLHWTDLGREPATKCPGPWLPGVKEKYDKG